MGTQKHGERRRAWRKLHVSVDPATSEIVAHELTNSDTSDAAMARTAGRRLGRQYPTGDRRRSLWRRTGHESHPRRPPGRVTAQDHHSSACQDQSLRPGKRMAAASGNATAPRSPMHGRLKWQQEHHYGLRSLAETGIGRLKGLTGGSPACPHLRSASRKEVAIDISVLNRPDPSGQTCDDQGEVRSPGRGKPTLLGRCTKAVKMREIRLCPVMRELTYSNKMMWCDFVQRYDAVAGALVG